MRNMDAIKMILDMLVLLRFENTYVCVLFSKQDVQ